MFKKMLMLLPVSLVVGAGALLLLPQLAFAHEQEALTIGGTPYLFEVGPIGEPVVVDDKSGVELIVHLADPADPNNFDAPAAQPVTGLEKTLKIEVSAADKKKTFDLTPDPDNPGTYHAVFYPTVQTVYTYRVFGTVNGVQVDFSTGCVSDMTQGKPDDTTQTQLSPGVVRTSDTGYFGCPVSKVEQGFPMMSASVQQLMQMSDMSNMDMTDHTTRDISYVAIGIGVIGVGVGVAGWRRKLR